MYHARGAKAGGGAAEEGRYNWRGEGDGGTDGAGVPTHLRPFFRGCERVGSMPLAVAVVCAHAPVFWAADCASGAALLPELTPPL